MPVDRFIHPRLGHSEKVNKLTELEKVVWIQYMLSADDFGVMRCAAVTVQADNDSLARKPVATIQRCLERLIEVELVREFEHQQRRYLYQRDWQRWQKIRYPRDTSNPCPPENDLQECDGETVELFRDHHGNFPITFIPRACASARADAKRLMANGERPEADGLRASFSKFWDAYPRKVGKESAWKIWQRMRPTSELQVQIIQALVRHEKSAQWLKDGGELIPHAKTWLFQRRWTDQLEPAKAPIGAVSGPECPHEPKCSGTWVCARKTQADNLKSEAV